LPVNCFVEGIISLGRLYLSEGVCNIAVIRNEVVTAMINEVIVHNEIIVCGFVL
jgi:hypothetical protein